MKSASPGVLLAIAFALAGFAHAAHGLAPPGGAGGAEPGNARTLDDVEDDCIKLPKNGCVSLQPGECGETKSGERVENTGQATIKVKTKNGKVDEIDLGESGQASYSGNDGDFDVTGGGSCSITITGNDNTVDVTMGANTGGGVVDVTGNGNTVNNNDNDKGGTIFNSSPTNPTGEDNTLNLGGEGGNISGGVWVVNP